MSTAKGKIREYWGVTRSPLVKAELITNTKELRNLIPEEGKKYGYFIICMETVMVIEVPSSTDTK